MAINTIRYKLYTTKPRDPGVYKLAGLEWILETLKSETHDFIFYAHSLWESKAYPGN